MTDSRKTALVAALDRFIHQRPGLDYGNYGDPVTYRAEVRSIGKDLQHARTLLRYVELRDSITADDIIDASKHAFSGRLTIAESAPGQFTLDYCTGQYWPTEYRRAVCGVLSSAIWAWLRDKCMPAPVAHRVASWGAKETSKPMPLHSAIDLLNAKGGREYGHLSDMYRRPGATSLVSAGDYLRTSAQREFGRSIAARWFN